MRNIQARLAQYHTTTARSYTALVPETFGERLRTLRTRRRLTPSALAYAVGVTEGAIRQMESGQTKTPSFLVGLKLAHVLGVTPAFLGTGRDAPPETGSPSSDRSLVLAERLATQIGALERRVKSLEAWRRAGTRRKAPE
jgi:transcriptional regulator with XRE-family HTH domain